MSKFSNSKIFKHPTAEDRTWPDSYNYLKNNELIKLDEDNEYMKIGLEKVYKRFLYK